MTDGRENLIVTNCKPCEEALLTLKFLIRMVCD